MATEARETAGLIGSDKVEGTAVYDARGEKMHIPPNYVVKPASFTIPLLFQAIPPMVCHELSRPHNLGVTHGTRSQTHTRKPHDHRRFSG
jgi:hypothetical protein